jgi:predicted dehydrogenase
LTHTYAGYQMVREARAMCAAGKLGKIRKVAVEYFQGWLSRPIETTGQKQAEWRTDPARNGPGGAIGDIGTHAFHLLEYVSGLEVTAINATLRSVVPGRKLDDDCNAFVRMNNGAAGTLACSQVAAGEMNELRLRIYGEDGSIEWRQEDPEPADCEVARQAGGDSPRGGELPGQRCAAVARTPAGIRKGIWRPSPCSIASLPMR